MIVFEHDILCHPSAIGFIIFEFVQEWIWNQYLEEYLPEDDLPVACGAKIIVFSDKFLDEEPLEVDHVSED